MDPTTKPKIGPKGKLDPKERRQTRSLPLNDYEYTALVMLADASGAKSTGSYLVKLLSLPSTKADAENFSVPT